MLIFITEYFFFADLVTVFCLVSCFFIVNSLFSCFFLIFKKVVEALLKMVKGQWIATCK